MDERRRFAVALSGVMGSIGLAAGIALTGPGLHTVAPLSEPARMASRPLPMLSMPDWASASAAPPVAPLAHVRRQPATETTVTSAGQRAAFNAVPAPEAPDVVRAFDVTPYRLADGPAHLQATTHAVVLTDAPDASAESALGAIERRPTRSPVASAFVVAGTEVGSGFKSVGRTLKRLF